jgi:hypothetical protein
MSLLTASNYNALNAQRVLSISYHSLQSHKER